MSRRYVTDMKVKIPVRERVRDSPKANNKSATTAVMESEKGRTKKKTSTQTESIITDEQ